jgi:hypothetical protein
MKTMFRFPCLPIALHRARLAQALGRGVVAFGIRIKYSHTQTERNEQDNQR